MRNTSYTFSQKYMYIHTGKASRHWSVHCSFLTYTRSGNDNKHWQPFSWGGTLSQRLNGLSCSFSNQSAIPNGEAGWPQSSRKKFPEFSKLFQSPKLTFPQVITTKSKCNNDLHQRSFHINSSNITGHHCTPTKYLNDELKILCLLQFYLRLHRIPSVFHVQRNPWVFQVFQVCGHPVKSPTHYGVHSFTAS